MRHTFPRLLIGLNEVYLWDRSLCNKYLSTSPIKEDSDEFITGEMVFSGLPENDIHFHINKPPWTYRSLLPQSLRSHNHEGSGIQQSMLQLPHG